jgi:hypothetical protein
LSAIFGGTDMQHQDRNHSPHLLDASNYWNSNSRAVQQPLGGQNGQPNIISAFRAARTKAAIPVS